MVPYVYLMNCFINDFFITTFTSRNEQLSIHRTIIAD